MVGITEKVIVTSSVASASSGRDIVTSIVPVLSLLCLDSVETVDDSHDTAQPRGGDDADTLNVSGPLP